MKDYIDRQAGKETADMPWGHFSTIGRGGCGAVAAYNVALALGRDPEFGAFVREMEQCRMPSFDGLFGVNVFRLKFWMQRRFGRAELVFLGSERWEERTRFCRAVILFYKNKGLFKGNHYIAGVRTQEGFVFHNAPRLPSTRAFEMHRAVHILKQAGNTPVFLMII